MMNQCDVKSCEDRSTPFKELKRTTFKITENRQGEVRGAVNFKNNFLSTRNNRETSFLERLCCD